MHHLPHLDLLRMACRFEAAELSDRTARHRREASDDLRRERRARRAARLAALWVWLARRLVRHSEPAAALRADPKAEPSGSRDAGETPSAPRRAA